MGLTASTSESSKSLTSCLVIGADSSIGSALISRMRKDGMLVYGTTRYPERVSEFNLLLDLAGDMDRWTCPIHVDVAVICAGVSSAATCALDPIRSKLVNVKGTTRLAERLISDGVFLIFLSSSHVFDGVKAYYRDDESTSPVTEYGRQKAEVEQSLGRWHESVAIVRLTKVLGPVNPLFTGWKKSLERGSAIKPFGDMRLAPVPISSVTSLLRVLIDTRPAGMWHVSGNRDVSYGDAARFCASLLHANQDLVRVVPAHEGGYPESVMSNTTLNTDRLKSELGITFPDVLWTLEKAFADPQALIMG